ncbi:hypothetical protein N7447_007321 [Penicillium robsamsonii]|uniref:uncharacterized protein n=1 Tax=Penicillium robsamsonii TaxID=1792511 RepID=UPI002548A733|nr:uncharacterized protein N7447_007321 [Penicillium robsamsonii]KAJ5824981.1 hypothetical protein N7447_007321 [Penicillium robsamsonii]
MGKIKWDAIADQTLLATILETHHLSVDAAKVAVAWPAQDEDHRPTPIAVKERLNRIKKLNRARNPDAATSGPSNPVTPKKSAPRKKAAEASTPAGPSRKRKRVMTDAAAGDDEQVNVKKEEGNESVVESLVKEEKDLEHINPRLHSYAKEESPDVDNGKGDADLTEDNEDHNSDSDQLPN